MKFKIPAIPDDFKEFLKKKENIKNIGLITLAIVILFMTQLIKGTGFKGKYIENENGNIIGISRNSIEKGLSIPIGYEIDDGNKVSDEEIMLYLKGQNNQEKATENKADSVEDKMGDAIYNIENSKEDKVWLPDSLDDGTKIDWYKPKEKLNWQLFLFLPLVVIMLYQNEKKKEKDVMINVRKGIQKSLPTFNNQLLLLLNSGLIFNDAFNRIAIGYKSRDLKNDNSLERGIVNIYDRTRDTNSSLISLINEYAKDIEVKEFSRLVSIISDNQYKGVNLNEKLELESEILWEQRKKNAEESGKIAETKLTFPLALLLLVLILITAAPAILQI